MGRDCQLPDISLKSPGRTPAVAVSVSVSVFVSESVSVLVSLLVSVSVPVSVSVSVPVSVSVSRQRVNRGHSMMPSVGLAWGWGQQRHSGGSWS